ncbi:NADH-quinone oxidoreductase subunit G [Candidatus Westeberhardia cardiocondylae]|uniref:NADH-quinone oxidoreductase n=1 Tax=Candidatus Westeberhardia cardiocondylae TaxID=1594731 RepID=A0A0H5BX77_9ENTR|nr:NADH-quinone oxidoreductase subunit NuoG [Candidatus Westeberhardia cardiocondylae]CEN32323.1 NADH-quinone oxidoreductase subunit G [Candidatus Westeberhardia cardiocondylae]
MTIIYINKKKYKVDQKDNLLKTCLNLGFNIPYFCWHPELGSIGSCRQCAIKKYKDKEDTTGQIIMSCMTPPDDNMIISTKDKETKNFRKNIIELLMINHPHDCPVCEEGGNCHLQDMTVMAQHTNRKYHFKKRTHKNQYIGPFITHEMNRCITCYRCVRYYKDYAGGNDFGVYGIHDNIYFGRYENGTLENEFSGNLIEICPTGVFTDKTHSKNYNRKWDMQSSPSICQQCSIGCNIFLEERYGKLRRIENRYNENINHHFLCDRGRFSYDYINLKNRPHQPKKKKNEKWINLTANEAIKYATKILKKSTKIWGIGSPRASIESNFALKELVGKENFSIGIPNQEKNELNLILNILENSGIHTPSIREIEDYDAILILGEDITQTGARMALSIRQAIKNTKKKYIKEQNIPNWNIRAIMNIRQNKKNPLFITNVDKTKLDDIATWTYYATTEEQAKFGFSIAHKLDKKSPHIKNMNPELKEEINLITKTLSQAKKPLIISGNGSGNKKIISAAANIAFALKKRGKKTVGISFVLSNVNSMGSIIIGGTSLNKIINTIKIEKQSSKNNTTLIVLENDLYRYLSTKTINSLMKKIKYLIVLDHQFNLTHKQSHLIFSATSYAESSGTVINHEGRAQRFFQTYDPSYYNSNIIMLESWRWLHWLHSSYTKKNLKWKKLDHIIHAITKKIKKLEKIKYVSPKESFRIHGQKLARMPHCYSGKAAIRAHINIHEKTTKKDFDSMFAFSMEGNNSLQFPHQQIAFSWSPGWNSSHSWNKFKNEIKCNSHLNNSGVLLFKKNKKNNLKYFNFSTEKQDSYISDNWYIAPYWHLFGSEETSQNSKFIKKRMPSIYIIISEKDVNILGNINSTTLLSFNCKNFKYCFPIKISKKLNRKHLGLPLGFPGIPTTLSGMKVTNLNIINV